jgi:hypothetical protein
MFKSVQHLDGYRIGGIHSGLLKVISCVAIAHHVTLLHSYICDRLIFLFGAPESNFPAHLIVALAIAEQTPGVVPCDVGSRSGFPLARRPGGCGGVATTTTSENSNPEKVSLSLD